MKWYLPSWNGDVRAESVPDDDPDRSLLTVIKPTLHEQKVLTELGVTLRKKGWLSEGVGLWKPDGPETQVTRVRTPLGKLGPLLVKAFKPGKQTLTAVKFQDGKIETVTGADSTTSLATAIEATPEKVPEAAATVKRATPCCPQCEPGSVGPATEVLLTFLDAEQHRQWAGDRYIVVRGGSTGHRYLLAHRHTPRAARMGRICFDIDDAIVVHFHDQSVPPEEEVLGAKLVLEHREPWLRNQATMLTGSPSLWRTAEVEHFDNPLGPGFLDGTDDMKVTSMVGGAILGAGGQLGLLLQ